MKRWVRVLLVAFCCLVISMPVFGRETKGNGAGGQNKTKSQKGTTQKSSAKKANKSQKKKTQKQSTKKKNPSSKKTKKKSGSSQTKKGAPKSTPKAPSTAGD